MEGEYNKTKVGKFGKGGTMWKIEMKMVTLH